MTNELSDWQEIDGALERTVELASFPEAIAFVNRLAEAAERENHHPDIAISWNTVDCTLSTHSQGGLTENDFELARQIDSVA